MQRAPAKTTSVTPMNRPASLWRRVLHWIAGFRPLNIIVAEVVNERGEIIAEHRGTRCR